jgi:hypothetical protein
MRSGSRAPGYPRLVNRRQPSLAVGVTLVVALIVACGPSALGPSQSPPSDLAIASGLAPETFASIVPDRSFGTVPTPGLAAKTGPGAKATPSAQPGSGATSTPTTAASGAPTPRPTAKPTSAPTPRPIAIPALSHCPIFPAANPWNEPVNTLPVAADSATMIAAIGLNAGLHPDFGSFAGYGIPYNIVGTSTPRSNVVFKYSSESDHVGYPIPSKPKIEAGSDRHLVLVDTNACRLYELFDATYSGGRWQAGSGATWSLNSNALRPAGWTSADAAGLPILPGLARYDQDLAGIIRHALRFTASSSCAGYVAPARHEAGSGSCNVEPPMGLRVRLKASVDISHFSPQAKVILQALKTYGMILADNGSPWYVSGVSDPHWNDDILHTLGQIKGSDFEVVDASGL